MNGIVLMLVAAVVLACGYLLYGRWLSNKWGVDAKALTPARRMEDGNSFSPASAFTVFSHQFSSICGAGPVTGTIVAMAFGWLPVVLWVLIGGIFFGAVHDFGALYASMKNNGKSLAQLIEKYIGKTGRRLFLIFSWLFCIIVIAAFTSMVCGTFKYTPAEAGGIDFAKSYAAGCAGTISILFTFVAIAFGWAQRKFNLDGAKEFVVAVVAIVLMFAVGMQFPLYLDLNQWIAVVMVYLVFAGAMPIQTLKQPRDYLTTIMMVVMIVCAVLGIVVLGVNGQATITAPVFTGFSTKSGMMFPVLFVSVACGALSGFHSLVSSSTSSKQVSNETDAVKVGYGAMVLESFVGVLAIIIAGIMFSDMNTAGTGALNNGVASTPFQIFAAGIARGMKAFGVDSTVATVFMTMNVSALALTSLDAVARIARTSFSEFFAKSNDALAIEDKSGAMKVLGNPWFATLPHPGPGPHLWRLPGHLAALRRLQPAPRRHDHDHPCRLLQVHRPQGRHALRARRLPALLHLHLPGPEHHGLRHRPVCRHRRLRLQLRAAARLCHPARGPWPHRCRELPARAVHQGVWLPARRGARVVRARPQELRRRGPRDQVAPGQALLA